MRLAILASCCLLVAGAATVGLIAQSDDAALPTVEVYKSPT